MDHVPTFANRGRTWGPTQMWNTEAWVKLCCPGSETAPLKPTEGLNGPPAGRIRAPASIHFGTSHLEYTEEGGKSYMARAGGISQRGRACPLWDGGFEQSNSRKPPHVSPKAGLDVGHRQERVDMGTVAYSQLPHLPKAGRYGAPSNHSLKEASTSR